MNEHDYLLVKNPLQGAAHRALFVCTGGILRSATAAHWAARDLGWNTRSCGTMTEAVPPVHANLLNWAERVYCFEGAHAAHIVERFGEGYEPKLQVLGIEDTFAYRDPALLKLLRVALNAEAARWASKI